MDSKWFHSDGQEIPNGIDDTIELFYADEAEVNPDFLRKSFHLNKGSNSKLEFTLAGGQFASRTSRNVMKDLVNATERGDTPGDENLSIWFGLMDGYSKDPRAIAVFVTKDYKDQDESTWHHVGWVPRGLTSQARRQFKGEEELIRGHFAKGQFVIYS